MRTHGGWTFLLTSHAGRNYFPLDAKRQKARAFGDSADGPINPVPERTLAEIRQTEEEINTTNLEIVKSDLPDPVNDVQDTTAPTITVALTPSELWPPNHEMVGVTAMVMANDICDPAPSLVLTSIVSNEPDDAPGNGDGNTTDDIQGASVGTPDFEFELRAERAGSGSGRTYTVTYTATDACGLSTSASADVFVPHHQ